MIEALTILVAAVGFFFAGYLIGGWICDRWLGRPDD